MALTELQLPSKETFYATLRTAATRMNTLMVNWQELAEILAFVEAADLDAMGIATGQVRTDISNFRVAVNELVGFYDGTHITAPTNTPEDVINKIRNITAQG